MRIALYSVGEVTMMKVVLAFLSLSTLIACSQAPVRSTVESYGEAGFDRNRTYYFELKSLSLLEKQSAEECKLAAKAAKLKVSNTLDQSVIPIEVHTKNLGTEQVVRSSPGFGSSFGIFGGSSGIGLGIGSGSDVNSSAEAGREVDLIFFSDREEKLRAREIQIRSVGRENSVAAVAFEMCQAAFQDYPQNLKGKVYEIDVRKK